MYAFFQEDNAAACTTNSFMLFCSVFGDKIKGDYGLVVCHVRTAAAVGFYLWNVLKNKAQGNNACTEDDLGIKLSLFITKTLTYN
jgi:hypothetical protein